MSNEVLKDKDGNILNPKIPRYEINIKEEISKTGRQVLGKDEYELRMSIGKMPNNDSKNIPLPIDFSSITPTMPLAVWGTSDLGEMIPAPRMVSSTAYINYYISDNNFVLTTTNDSSRFDAFLILTFTYN